MIQGYRLAGKAFPPKAQGHVSQPVQLKVSIPLTIVTILDTIPLVILAQ